MSNYYEANLVPKLCCLMSIGSEKAMGEEEPKYSIVVVGAGIAGLAAAKELSKCFPDVLVVEASDRLGGRIKQVRF